MENDYMFLPFFKNLLLYSEVRLLHHPQTFTNMCKKDTFWIASSQFCWKSIQKVCLLIFPPPTYKKAQCWQETVLF